MPLQLAALPCSQWPSAPNLRPLPNPHALCPQPMPPPQCEDTEAEIIVFKKGEIVDVPCHYEHKVGAGQSAGQILMHHPACRPRSAGQSGWRYVLRLGPAQPGILPTR